jgi:hypothetical protein
MYATLETHNPKIKCLIYRQFPLISKMIFTQFYRIFQILYLSLPIQASGEFTGSQSPLEEHRHCDIKARALFECLDELSNCPRPQ